MTKEEIIEMARQAGMMTRVLYLGRNLELLTNFAKLVARHEREASAKIVDDWFHSLASEPEMEKIAEQIRARG